MTDSEIEQLLKQTLERLVVAKTIPASTYRLQFNSGFTFRDAAAIVPYLRDLGITHCYASPYLKATPGSTHGYDVVDHTRLNDELGTREDFDTFVRTLLEHGMRHVLDTVPNHMGVASNENPKWNELLASGRDGPAAHFFDVAWDESPRDELRSRVLLPVLGEPYGDALESGKLVLKFNGKKAVVAYYDREFPIAQRISPDDVDSYNGTPGDAASFDKLDALLCEQHYRLACWKTASDEINYRRFFDVTSLAALSMERLDVFDEAHALTLSLIAQGHLAGLRVDHSDGLLDPAAYFLRLQRETLIACALHSAGQSDDALRERCRRVAPQVLPDDHAGPWPLYLITEKILAPGEALPRWAIDGTSGYDVLNEINGLFVEPEGAATLERVYRTFVPDAAIDYATLAFEKKRQTLVTSFAGELNLLTRLLDRLAQADRHTRDFTFAKLNEALAITIPSFGVYRSYVTDAGPAADDVATVDKAIDRAIRRAPALETPIFRFIGDALLLRGRYADRLRAEAAIFAAKFQQLTSPVTAKGLEDCAFYIYHRLISVNEVGGEPSRASVSAGELHNYLAARQREWPAAMSVLSTHDTKRSEDVRARINVLSELADEWSQEVGRWHAMNRAENVHPNDEYLLYQTLVGAWPDGPIDNEFCERIQAYMLKALREAKVRTSWASPDQSVEQGMHALVARLLDAERGRLFQDAFVPFQRRVARVGRINSLAQTLIRLCAPGMPDTYQGTELFDLSLVDPDNRRPVDYALRQRLLREVDSTSADALLESPSDGRMKLKVTAAALRLRRERPELFLRGDYVPVRMVGEQAGRVFAFDLVWGGQRLRVIVPRCVAGRVDEQGQIEWGDTRVELQEGDAWTDVLRGTRVEMRSIGSALAGWPVGMWLSA
jgi:(1->4)-alpha-D-glucan 1-alpha-D-glucosylmutase